MRWLVRTTNGKSDQGGCLPTQSVRAASPVLKASSATTAAPAPSCRAFTNWSMSLHTTAVRPAAPSWSAAASPSRPVGAKTRTLVRGPDLNTAFCQAKLADGVLVSAAALFNHRQRATHQPVGLEIAKHDHCVAQVADIQRRLHRAHQAVLGEDQDGHHAELI